MPSLCTLGDPCCYNRMTENGYFTKNRNLFLTVMEAGKSKTKDQHRTRAAPEGRDAVSSLAEVEGHTGPTPSVKPFYDSRAQRAKPRPKGSASQYSCTGDYIFYIGILMGAVRLQPHGSRQPLLSILPIAEQPSPWLLFPPGSPSFRPQSRAAGLGCAIASSPCACPGFGRSAPLVLLPPHFQGLAHNENVEPLVRKTDSI